MPKQVPEFELREAGNNPVVAKLHADTVRAMKGLFERHGPNFTDITPIFASISFALGEMAGCGDGETQAILTELVMRNFTQGLRHSPANEGASGVERTN